MDAQHLRAYTRYPEAVVEDGSQALASIQGSASHLQVQYQTRDWFATVRYRDFSPDFRADAGFVPRVDQRSVSAWANRSIWPSTDSWYESFRVGLGTWYFTNRSGDWMREECGRRSPTPGPYSRCSVSVPTSSVSSSSAEEHTQFRWYLDARVTPTRGLLLTLDAIIGTQIDFENGGLGHGRTWKLSAGSRLGRHLDVQGTVSLQRLDDRERRNVFDAQLIDGRIVYHFSTRLFLRATFQRNRSRRDPDQYRDPVERLRVRTGEQLLLSYQVNPQSVAFLGYSNAGFRSVDAAGSPTVFTPVRSTFFLKLSYAWQR